MSDSYCIITPSEIGVSNIFVLDVNIERSQTYDYQFVIGHAFDSSGNLFVYFYNPFTANNVPIMIHYCNVR